MESKEKNAFRKLFFSLDWNWRIPVKWSLLMVFLLSFAPTVRACSAFGAFSRNSALFAKNYDWVQGQGHMVVNLRGLAKTALLRTPEEPFSWVSKYGSLTFNQFGRDLPNGGMNEVGLAIEILWLNTAVYPGPDRRAAINEVQWIQYLLDTSRSVDEMIRNSRKARLSRRFAAIHYMACDSSGECAVFEPLKGDLKIYKERLVPMNVLTNSEYLESLEYLRNFQGFGGTREIPKDSYASLDRFVTLSHRAREIQRQRNASEQIKGAFLALDEVQNEFTTMWKIVYDLKKKRVYLKTFGEQAHTIKQVDLLGFDLSCQAQSMLFDIESERSGLINSQFFPYSYAANLEKVKVAARIIKDATEAEIEAVSRLPERAQCLSSAVN